MTIYSCRDASSLLIDDSVAAAPATAAAAATKPATAEERFFFACFDFSPPLRALFSFLFLASLTLDELLKNGNIFSPTSMSQVCSGKSCIKREKEKKNFYTYIQNVSFTNFMATAGLNLSAKAICTTREKFGISLLRN